MRKRISKGGSRRLFRATAKKTKALNTGLTARGSTRL